MALLGPYLAACALLTAAGAAKAARPHDTARALAATLRPFRWHGSTLVRLLAALEATLGAAGAVWPARPLAAAIAASYLAFAGFVLLARARGGPLSTCGCFGTPDTPPTLLHAVVDVAAAVAAATVAGAASGRLLPAVLAGQYGSGVPLAAASALAAWLAYVALVPLARLGAARESLRRRQ